MHTAPETDLLIFVKELSLGGAERMALTLANGMARRGHRVILLTMRSGGEFSDLIDDRVSVRALDGHRMRTALWAIRRIIRETRPKAVLSVLIEMNLLAILAARLAGTSTRVIATEHNQLALFRGWSPVVRRLLPITPFIYRMADHLVCCSEGIREEWAKQFGMRGGRISAIYNPLIDGALDDAAEQLPAHEWTLDHSVPLIVASGRLEPAKDFATLLRAFSVLVSERPARLIILGKGKLRGRLENLARTLNIDHAVALPGYTDNPFSYYRRADVVALSSPCEGFPSVLVEALACGTDVVTTACLSETDLAVIRDWVHGIVPVGDHVALAGALGQALKTPHDPALLKSHVAHLTEQRSLDQYEQLAFGGSEEAQRLQPVEAVGAP